MLSKGLTNNQLKLLAMVTMTLDHVGIAFFPQVQWLRILGRLALPIYAFMIAEGCHHSRNIARYLLSLAAMAALCQGVYFFAMGSLYMCILVTFSLSVGLICLIRNAQKARTVVAWLTVTMAVGAVFFLCNILPRLLTNTDFSIDYGFIGVMLPVCIYLGRDKFAKLVLTGLGLTCLSIASGGVQWWSLLAVPVLMLYNGQRGKGNLKWFFYLFYPAHLAIIYAIGLIL